jgi:hypothetical protein
MAKFYRVSSVIERPNQQDFWFSVVGEGLPRIADGPAAASRQSVQRQTTGRRQEEDTKPSDAIRLLQALTTPSMEAVSPSRLWRERCA